MFWFKRKHHIMRFTPCAASKSLVEKEILTAVETHSDGTVSYELPHWIWKYLKKNPNLLET